MAPPRRAQPEQAMGLTGELADHAYSLSISADELVLPREPKPLRDGSCNLGREPDGALLSVQWDYGLRGEIAEDALVRSHALTLVNRRGGPLGPAYLLLP